MTRWNRQFDGGKPLMNCMSSNTTSSVKSVRLIRLCSFLVLKILNLKK